MAQGWTNLLFPSGGLDRRLAFQAQRPYTTPSCMNVVASSPVDGRDRGGSRPGLSRVFPGQPATASTIIVPFRHLGTGGTFQRTYQEGFDYGDTKELVQANPDWVKRGGYESVLVNAGGFAFVDRGYGDGRYASGAAIGPSLGLTSQKQTLRMFLPFFLTTANTTMEASLFACVNNDLNVPVNVVEVTLLYQEPNNSAGFLTATARANNSEYSRSSVSCPVPDQALLPLVLDIGASTATASYNGVSVTIQIPTYSQFRFGFALADPSSTLPSKPVGVEDFSLSYPVVEAESNRSRVFFGGNAAYYIEEDGQANGFINATIQSWPGAGTPATAAVDYSRKVYIVNGHATSGPGEFDPADFTIKELVATAGEVPSNCTLVTVFNDRLVLAGDKKAPQVWYMARRGVPSDWDYASADAGADRAVAGTNSAAGRIGQPIRALIPFMDDYLIFGCSSSMWILRGDPGYGGTLDSLAGSDGIGVFSANAWCRTPEGVILFLSPSGMFEVAPGAELPRPLSEDRLPREFKSLSYAEHSVFMVYDHETYGAYIFIRKLNGSGHTMWWYDRRLSGFFPLSVRDAEMFPTVAAYYGSDDLSRRGVLVSGPDRWMRRFNPNARNDDGTRIRSSCHIGPIKLGTGGMGAILDELAGIMGESSDAVTWSLYVGDSEEDAFLKATPIATGDFRGGRGLTHRPHIRGQSMFLVLSSDGGRWMMERVEARIRESGKMRVSV